MKSLFFAGSTRFFIHLSSMDDFKIWIYIIIGAIYVLSRLRKRPDQSPPETGHTTPPVRETNESRPSSPQKQLTFEELLREITEGKQAEEKRMYQPKPADERPVYQPKPAYVEPRKVQPTAYVDYDDDLKDETEDLEDVDYDYAKQNKLYEPYEDAKKQAFNRPSLEETMKVEDTIVKFSKFKVFEEQKGRNLLEEYTRDLRDPEGFKKALVLSEILNRRF
jgi:hypothetical protein